MSFDSAPQIIEFAKNICSKYEPEVVNGAHSSSTGMTKIIKHCVGNTFKEIILNDLKECPYSLLIDCTSGSYGDSYIAVLVRYMKNSIEGP